MTDATLESETARGRGGRALAVAAALAAAAALWALFLWTELVAARGGGTPLCAFGGGDCGELWDAAFAVSVHRLTGLPVAAWGLVWGVAALLLPLAALAALADGRATARLLGAVRWTAAAGLAGLVVLLGASAVEGLFCTSCALTYVLTVAYGAVVFAFLGRGFPLRRRGWETALATAAGAYLLLLYPGLETPRNTAREEQRALAEAVERQEAAHATGSAKAGAETPASGPAETRLERQLAEYVGSLRPPLTRQLSDALAMYRSARHYEEEPRALEGPADAPVRITEFTDTLCSHCANLHDTISYLRNTLPAESFAVDARQFPLDGNCNDKLRVRGPESVRCLAARAQICMEGKPEAFAYAGALFENQQQLTPEMVYELAGPYMSRAALEACVASPETERKLADDVEYAWHFEPRGTPVVLVNGRETPYFVPLLYTLVLAGGDADHPLFASLPPPSAAAQR